MKGNDGMKKVMSVTAGRPDAAAVAVAKSKAIVPEVIGKGSPEAMRLDAAGVAEMVERDIATAQVGRFFALRAGIGLMVIHEMCGHGQYQLAVAEMMPGRSGRTLHRYKSAAAEFVEANGLEARAVWADLSKVGRQARIADGGRLMIGDGKERDKEAPPLARALAEWIVKQEDEQKKKKEAPGKKPMTKAEKLRAAIDRAQMVAEEADDWIRGGDWTLLPDDNLESAMSALRSALDRLREETKKRASKK